ncbi:hypothetical protein [Glaciecola sp.]|jgi:hypothetical protein|uniref:hypothetical protein n=1 Tax=Glaciecola sp. MF2-115 TaxID=3384827 RepID=UPI0039896EBB
MKNLTDAEQKMISGGNPLAGFLWTYLGEKLVEAALEAASEVDDMYQNPDMRLPYNRL